MARRKVSKKRLREAIEKARGKKTGICELLNIARPTLDRYLRDEPDMQAFYEFTIERGFDRAEFKLDEAIERGESWAVKLKLESHKEGRRRGYGKALDITSDGKGISWKDFISGDTDSDSE